MNIDARFEWHACEPNDASAEAVVRARIREAYEADPKWTAQIFLRSTRKSPYSSGWDDSPAQPVVYIVFTKPGES